MTKKERLNAICDLISEYEISTQEELTEKLVEKGFDVSQATVSRDINELKLKKIKENGTFRYVQSTRDYASGDEKISTIFRQTVHSIVSSGNLIVIKTLAGSANAVCAIIDGFDIDGVLGSIAGDDCIFVAADADVAEKIASRFRAYLTDNR